MNHNNVTQIEADMDLPFKIKYLSQIRKRYFCSSKKDKSIILNELCSVTGLSRKHAIRVLSTGHISSKKASGRSKSYSPETAKHLQRLWHILGHICSKKMVSALPVWIKYYEADGFTEKIQDQLLNMSSTTIDRYLRAHKAQYGRRKRTGTRKSKKFKNIIPIKNFDHYAKAPGYLQADTVAHCGNSISGKFVWSITITDEYSGWTENRAVFGKEKTPILEGIVDILWKFPFKPITFNSDNGTEFINSELHNYICNNQKIKFTRSRAYRKNDNCHVEQKNFTHVRELFGYDRLDRSEIVDEMNRIYKNYFNILQNFFIPQIKTKELTRVGSTYKRKCDEAKTPYQRLMESKDLSIYKKNELKRKFETLNPIILRRELNALMAKFNQEIKELDEFQEAA